MYSVLIVDDEIHAVEGVKAGVDWNSLHVDKVHTAHNNRQAKAVFKNHSIDIMLCDIEMPKETGLDLLAWAREFHPRTECIFLTCHADFHFAKQAIQLDSMDYLLKPVPFDELEEVIKKAADKINKEQALQQGSMLGENWIKNQPLLIERFWHDVLNGTIESNLQAVKEAAEKRSLELDVNQQIMPTLVSFQGENEKIEEMRVLKQMLISKGEKFFFDQNGHNGKIIRQGQESLIVLLSIEGEVKLNADQLKQLFQSYIEECHQAFGCNLSCYLGNAVQVDQLITIVDELFDMDRNNVSFLNKAFAIDEEIIIDSTIQLPDMSIWSVMLQEGKYDYVIREASSSLDRMYKEGIDMKQLRNFYHDFQQMLYFTLKQKGIQAHLIFNDNRSLQKLNQACRSVKDLKEWISQSAARVKEFSENHHKSDSVLEKAIKYITANIDQNISREDIANEVYLNPDYLSRIFKKEIGLSISEYLVNERMNISKELLEKTDMSVSSVAAYVGYSNFSYFSKLFKKNLGETPVEYRLNVQKRTS